MDAVWVGFEVAKSHLPLWERADWRYAFLMGGRGNGRSGTASRYSVSRLLSKEYTRGAIKGLADILAIKDSKAIFLEVKSETSRPSKDQLDGREPRTRRQARQAHRRPRQEAAIRRLTLSTIQEFGPCRGIRAARSWLSPSHAAWAQNAWDGDNPSRRHNSARAFRRMSRRTSLCRVVRASSARACAYPQRRAAVQRDAWPRRTGRYYSTTIFTRSPALRASP
jgi:hypothetical protein